MGHEAPANDQRKHRARRLVGGEQLLQRIAKDRVCRRLHIRFEICNQGLQCRDFERVRRSGFAGERDHQTVGGIGIALVRHLSREL